MQRSEMVRDMQSTTERFIHPEFVLTGQRHGAVPFAQPASQLESSVVREIQLTGGLTDGLSALGFEICCAHAWRDRGCQLVIITIDSVRSTWCVADYVDSVTALSSRKPTVAYVRCLLGAGLVLPFFCHSVFAMASAQIGELRSFIADGRDGPACLDTLDDCTLDSLQALRPRVDAQIWLRLMNHRMLGEHAEAAGIIDGLASSPAAIVDHLNRGHR